MNLESNTLIINDPVTIIGDIHGQYYDLVKILELSQEESLLFLGDFVDRGSYSVEVIIVVFILKINNPSNISILRGNHECR